MAAQALQEFFRWLRISIIYSPLLFSFVVFNLREMKLLRFGALSGAVLLVGFYKLLLGGKEILGAVEPLDV